MSGGEVFGPAGGGAVDAAPFSVTGPSQVSLDASRSATASFVVSNLTGRPVRARLLPVPGAGAQAGWLRVDGATERELPVAGTTTVDVVVRAADDAPAGAGSFVLGVALEESPDRVVSGPTVAFQVPEAGKKRFPWWIVIVAVAAVLLLVGGGILIWILTRPDTPPDTPPVVPPQEPAAIVISVDGLVVSDAEGEAMRSAEFADGEDILALLSETTGETPEPQRNAVGYPITTYDWGEISISVVDDGPATMWASSDDIEGIDLRTTEGIEVGWSRDEAVAAGATADLLADSLRLQVEDVPGTKSLQTSGVGVQFVLLVLEEDEVVRIIAPSNDYGDL